MPRWFEGMTTEDHEKNMEEHRRYELSRARGLRAEARALISEAERIEAIWTDTTEDPPHDQ